MSKKTQKREKIAHWFYLSGVIIGFVWVLISLAQYQYYGDNTVESFWLILAFVLTGFGVFLYSIES